MASFTYWPIGQAGPAGPTGPTGPTGPAGYSPIWHTGSTEPPSNGLGNNGDMYLDSVSLNLYGPKAAGVWGSVVATLGGGGGSFVLLDVQTAFGSAALNFTSDIDATYDVYEFVFVGILPATDGAKIGFQFSTDNGATYDTTSGHYHWQALAITSAGVGGNGGNDVAINVTNSQSNTATIVFAGTVRLYNPLGGDRKYMIGAFNGYGVGGSTPFGWMTTGEYLTNPTAVNAVRVIASSGNIASGTVYMFGLTKV